MKDEKDGIPLPQLCAAAGVTHGQGYNAALKGIIKATRGPTGRWTANLAEASKLRDFINAPRRPR